MANSFYLTRLESDYVYLTQKNPEKRVFLDVESDLVLWVWAFGNTEKLRFINGYGDLMESRSKSKLKLGSWIKIWAKQEQIIIKR